MPRIPLLTALTTAWTAVVMTCALTVSALPANAAQGILAQRKVETWLTPGATAITLTGHGFGHGNGMSQYGALGAAQQGLTWQQIVAFYYPGTTLEPMGGKIRVLLTADTTPDVQVVAVRGLKVTSLTRNRTWRVPALAARKWRLIATGQDTAVQWTKGGRWRTWKKVPGEAEFSSATGQLTLVTPAERRTYRGTLRSVAPRASRKRQTVNRLSLESYLRGVVPREVPPLWAAEAVRSQSVAARTYAAFERSHPNAAHYDLCDTTQCQVYGGVADEHPDADAAIRATAKQGLYYNSRPAFTQFSASNGGFSSAGSMPYLVAQADPYDGTSGHSYSTWTESVDDSQIERHWPTIGDLTSIEVTTRDGNGEWGGRVTDMAFIGTTGTARVDGDTVRTFLGLYSDWFTFSVAPRQKGPAGP